MPVNLLKSESRVELAAVPADPEIEIGDPEITVNELQDTVPEQLAVFVATLPSNAGVAFVEVQYERKPDVSEVEVATFPDPPPPPVHVPDPRSPVPSVPRHALFASDGIRTPIESRTGCSTFDMTFHV